MRYSVIFLGCLLISLFFYTDLFGQEDFIRNKVTIPPSPTAASLGKYGEVPVSHFTGIPEISVPVYEVVSGGIKVPLYLSYNYNGFKPNERASWVGLGWSLNAGGVITRVIRGKADHSVNGYHDVLGVGGTIEPPDPITDRSNFLNFYNQLTESNKAMLASGTWDGIPDLYYYNFLGKSGQFFFTKNGIVTLPYSALKITLNGDNWEITDEQGIKYVFGVSEGRSGLESTEYDNSNAPPGGLIPPAVTAWNLVDIIDPKGGWVKFNYSIESFNTYGQDVQSYYLYTGAGNICSDMAGPVTTVGPLYTINARRLTSIMFPSGQIDFVANTPRNDVYTGEQVRRLDKIQLYDNVGLLKSFNFSYSYLGSGVNTSTKIYNRLMLTSITEEDQVGALKNPYSFSYNTGAIVEMNSYSIDHWGYYNGKSNGTSILPKNIGSPYDLSFFPSGGGADREPDHIYALRGLISTIRYPTGGSTTFQYEPHDYSNINGTDYPGEYATTSQYISANVYNPASGPNTVSEQVIPFTLSHDQQITVNYRIEQLDMMGLGEQYVAVYKTGQSAPVFITSEDEGSIKSVSLSLAAGSYTLVAHIESKGYRADINTTYTTYDYNTFIKNKVAGGLRIRRLTHSGFGGEIPDQTVEFIYRLTQDGEKSSGVLNASPVYEYLSKRVAVEFTGGQNPMPVEHVCNFRVRSSHSLSSLSGGGAHVTYREVKIVYGNNGEYGTTKKWFTSALEFPDQVFDDPPFAPTKSQADKRGKLTRQIDYDQSNRKMLETANVYEYNSSLSSPNVSSLPLLSVTFDEEHSYYPAQHKFYYVLYNTQSSWQYLKSTIKTSYYYSTGSQVDSVREEVNYRYSNPAHIQLSATEVNSSDGNKEVTYTSYPHDYSNTTGVIGEMKSNHLIAYPIEQVRYLEVGSTRTILSGSITTYKTGGKGLVDQVLALETAAPVALSSFKFSNRATGVLPPSGTVGSYSPDTRYKVRQTYNEYDAKGNPLQVTQADGVSTSYVWGYGGQYPVAEIRNATRSAVVTALGGSTAVNSFGGQASPSEAAVAGFLSPLRSAATMNKARVSTYTYRPLVGMSSSTDASGRTTWYDYDGFGRLWRTRDQSGNVIEEYKYNYRP